MKNQRFDSQTTIERKQKLRAVLKTQTGGALTTGEIDSIVNRVSSYRQYTIKLYSDPSSFVQSARLTEPNLSCPLRDSRPMTVVTKRDRGEEGELSRECVIHIFMPMKGESSVEQRSQKTYRV